MMGHETLLTYPVVWRTVLGESCGPPRPSQPKGLAFFIFALRFGGNKGIKHRNVLFTDSESGKYA